jgi:signal transduction histidine kinase
VAVSLVLVQAALIAGLLVQASRRRQAEKHLLASQRKLSATHARISDLGRRLIQAQEGERSHIARELHDDISQQIALLSIEVHTLIGSAWPSPRDKKPLRELMERVESLAKSVHDLSHRLYPAKLRLLGLVAGIKSLQRDFSQPDVLVVFTHQMGPAVIPHDVTLCVFRVVQEGLTNAIKHSGAREICVHLADNGDGLALTIVDDGSGFDVDTRYGKGLGLISMKERLEAVGGSLTIQSAPGSGTRIEASVVLSAAKAVQTVAV